MISALAAAFALAVAAQGGGAARNGSKAAHLADEPARERVVEEVVAVVRNPPRAPPRIVTMTKLIEEARVALVSRGATAAATGPLDQAALRAALDWLVDQMLVADEAARLRIDEVPREDVLAELRRFRGRFGAPAEYERFLAASELSEDELLVTLARMVRVQRYLESRVGAAARVGEDDVDRWLRERGAPATAGRPEREAARAQLVEERARAQVKELLAELRGRADVRLVDRAGGRDEAAPPSPPLAPGQPHPAAPANDLAGGHDEAAPPSPPLAPGQPHPAAPANDLAGGHDEAAPPSPPLAPGQPHPAAPALAPPRAAHAAGEG